MRTSGRWITAALVVGVAALLALTATVLRHDPPSPNATTTAPPRATGSTPTGPPLPAGVDALPIAGGEADLPARRTPLPPVATVSSVRAARLSESPVRRALALFETGAPDAGVGAVLVLGDDGNARVLDAVALAPATDVDGNAHSPVGPGTLAPDGKLAAFPQRDRLVIVDLTTAEARDIAVPGFNEYVAWLGERVVVAQARGSALVDPRSGRVTAVPYPGAGVAASATSSQTVRELVGGGEQRLAVRTWTTGAAPTASPPVRIEAVPAGARWVRPGWVREALLAVEVMGTPAMPGGQARAAVVVDVAGAVVRRSLLLGAGTPGDQRTNCCAVLGWLDDHTVLVLVRGGEAERIIAWDVGDGDLTVVSTIDIDAGLRSMSLADLAR